MAKAKNPDSSVAELLLKTAIERAGFVIKPFPEGVDVQAAATALEELRQQGLVHGSHREPNLTREGADMARALAA